MNNKQNGGNKGRVVSLDEVTRHEILDTNIKHTLSAKVDARSLSADHRT